jgi:predicted alpha/beta superfamily hydrolase
MRLFFLSFFWLNALWAAPGFILFKKGFKTHALPHPRDIYVYLPDGYEAHEKKLPVLFMHDGQNLFNPSRAFMGKTWQLEKTLNRLIEQKKIPPIIVVGIDNTPDRINEYTPHFDPDQNRGGKGSQYLEMIVSDLRPLLLQHFKIDQRRKFTGIMGSSLGGLISLYAGAKYSQEFGLVGALSPSIWWNKKSILNTLKRSPMPLKIYLDSGTGEGESALETMEAAELYAQLRDNMWVFIQQNSPHNEAAWAQRLPLALEFLYGH